METYTPSKNFAQAFNKLMNSRVDLTKYLSKMSLKEGTREFVWKIQAVPKSDVTLPIL